MPDNHQARTDPMQAGPKGKRRVISGLVLAGLAIGILVLIAFVR